MTNRDEYYNRAKQQGYRSRSAFKLKQLDEMANLLDTGGTVVDLGAAPGGWLQVAAEAVGPEGHVIGVDRQRIDPLEAYENVETIRADIEADETVSRLRELTDSAADCVLSDAAPNISGESELDQARSLYLAQLAGSIGREILSPGGDLAVKVFQGPDVSEFRAELESAFRYVQTTSPDASRESSSEVYLIGKEFSPTPVSPGDTLEVEIVDVGAEGDGVARVEGYTLFVPQTEPGDVVTVQVEAVKPTVGFASRVK